jgi:anhydro-N-acetylmuramic acid kinase
MNVQIKKLADLSQSKSRVIIGLMSGTSLDGLDIALCRFNGSGTDTKMELLHFRTVSYTPDFKKDLKSISFQSLADLQKITLLNALIGNYYAELILECLQEWQFPVQEVDLIASHGQTIFHAPYSLHHLAEYPNATLQIGDGDHIAVKTGIITLSDFRQKHLAAGGEGAPLAVYGDFLLFASATENRILLNIGGIANFTFLPAGKDPRLVFSTDVGPGNTLMDQFVQLHYPEKHYDDNALLASQGRIDQALLNALMSNAFFTRPFPKTTGPELFSLCYLNNAISSSESTGLSNEDILATLCEFTAQTISNALSKTFANDQAFKVYLSGGGMHNPLLVQGLSRLLNIELNNTGDLQLNPDAKEAVLFALLANECVAGGRLNFHGRPGLPSISMGKISLPE